MNVHSFILCHQTVRNLRCAREAQSSMKFTKRFRLNVKPQTSFREDSGHLFLSCYRYIALLLTGVCIAGYSLLLFGQLVCNRINDVLICYQYMTTVY